MVVAGTYDPYLVALSIMVAALASYTALDLGGRVAAARGLGRPVWLAAAAITMGGGIWSMHFVAMLAFIMPTQMSYEIGLTTLSLVVAIFVTGGGFYVGMGLSICHSIIEAHGGRLWAGANVPHGAVFQFTLPVQADSPS